MSSSSGFGRPGGGCPLATSRTIAMISCTVSPRMSDKIAVIASAVAFLQFLAMIATVFVMRRTAQRQLRAYVHIEDVVTSEMNSVYDPNK
jgi:hypothetical protein